MVDHFPADLCRQILLHLPVKSLIRFTAVSKSWRSLITSPSFIHAHISYAKIHTLFEHTPSDELQDSHHTYSVLDFNEKNGFNSCYDLPRLCIPKMGQLGLVGFFGQHLGVVGSCDGLVCLTNYVLSFAVWNPSVHNHVVIPENPRFAEVGSVPLYGSFFAAVGFGVADHVYKLVCIMKNGSDGDGDAHIYSIGTGRWRRIQGFVVTKRLGKCQTLLKGRLLHWYNWGWILAFEIGSEVFRKIMLPDLLVSRKPYKNLHLLEIEGSLAVWECSGNNGNACNVWIMKEYGVQESWTKLYRIDVAEHFEGVVGFRKGEALLAHWRMQLVAYNPETRKTNNLGIDGTPLDDYYVESLLLLKGSLV